MPSGAESSNILTEVMRVIQARKAGQGATNAEGGSYVRSLLAKGRHKVNEKIAEEAMELTHAIASESDARVASEAADLIFHVLVGLAHRNLGLAEVEEVFASRFGLSGIDEKAQREPR